VTDLGGDKDMLVRAAVGFIEWCCWKCGASGAGLMPEDHASGACEATRRTPRLVPEAARAAQYTVREALDGAPWFADGGGI
jgi:hypothetical protein